MAEMITTYKVMPESPEVDLDGLTEKIRAIPDIRVNSVEKEPIAFGLVALKVAVVTEESEEGAPEEILGSIKALEGVREVEIVNMSRALG